MRVLCLAALAAVLPVPVAAQESGEPLSLRAAVAEAVDRNAELVALRRQFEAARAAPEQERHLDPPMFETQIWGWPLTTLNPARTEMYMLMGEQAITGRGKRAARTLVGEHDAEIERHQIAVRANEILDEVRQAFADITRGRATLALFEEQAAVLRDIADAATVRYAAGHSGQHDTVRSVAELVRVDAERVTWRGELRVAEARLNAVLGRPVDGPIESLAPPAPGIPVADAVRLALERHPVLARSRAEIAREEAELVRLRGERRPDFVVGGGYMLQPGEAGAWTVRAGLSWPNAPWSRRRLDAAIAAQEQRLEAVRARLAAVERDVRRDVQSAAVRLEAAQQRLMLLERTLLPHLDHAMEVARVAYVSNRGGFADLLDTQRVLITTRAETIAARSDVERAWSELDRAAGAVLEDAR